MPKTTTPSPFSNNWYKSLNSTFKQCSEGIYRDHESIEKIAKAVRTMLRKSGESLTVNEILNIIDTPRQQGIFAGHLGQELRNLDWGISYTFTSRNNPDKYIYKYHKAPTKFVEPK